MYDFWIKSAFQTNFMFNNQNIQQGGKFLADLQYLLYLVSSSSYTMVRFLLPLFLLGL